MVIAPKTGRALRSSPKALQVDIEAILPEPEALPILLC
jgi:hypothetical protein